MIQDKIEILQRALKREKAARKEAEKILDDKSKNLYYLSEELRKTNLRLENLLNEKSTQLQGVFENINDAYIVIDLFGNVLKMNDVAIDMFGYDIEKEVFNVTDLICDSYSEYSYQSFEKLKDEGSFTNFTSRVITKHKNLKWVQINASIIVNKDNNPIAAQGIIRDITNTKEAEDLLIESENRLSSLIQNLYTGVLLEDENRKLVLTNTKFCDLFKIQLTPEALIGLDCSNASKSRKLLFKDLDSFSSRVNKILKNKKQVLGEELLMKDGRTLEIDFVPILKGDEYKGHLWTFRDITLTKQYSKILETQKEKYSSIITNMNLGLLEVDLNDKILMANQSFSKMSGYTEEELIGKTGRKVFLSSTDENIISEQNLKRLNGKSSSFELQVRNKKNKLKHWLISGAPNYDLNGVVNGSIGIHLDITQAKLNTELIKEQKRELDIIINNTPVGIVLTQLGNILKTNLTFQKMLGFSEKELTKRTLVSFLIPEDFEESEYNLLKISRGYIDSFSSNNRYRKSDGSIIWAKSDVNAVRDSQGNIKYLLTLIEDITYEREKKLIIDMVNNLTKSILGVTDIYQIAWEIVNKIADYLDSNDCVIYIVDHKKKTLEQLAVYGQKLDERKKIKNKLIIPIGEGVVGSVVKTGVSEIIKDTSLDKRYIVDDAIRFSEITVPIIIDGEVIGIIDSEHSEKNYYSQKNIEVLESIANIVAIQLKTALSIRKLEEKEGQNKQLLYELENSNNELQEYAHIVSHDLKTPLRSIDALVSWIKTDNKDQFDLPTTQNFELIETTLETMEQLISNVLEYSSSGFKTDNPQEIDLNLLLIDIKKILFIPNNLSINILKKLPKIKGEKTKFQQLFLNLINNAITFLNKEYSIIEIDFIEKKIFYQFSIKDNGMGIDKRFHDKIFKIFYHLNNNKKSTGIGLSIVKKIVNFYNGDIWLESELGVGTTFYFTIKK
jgi:PAS domain S-box-containing protein